jgi:DNA-directed RNA polymerase alpha subunit
MSFDWEDDAEDKEVLPPISNTHLDGSPENQPLEALGLSGRILSVLHRINVWTVGQACQITENDFLKQPNAGKTSLEQLRTALLMTGLPCRIKMSDSLKLSAQSLLSEAERLEKYSAKLRRAARVMSK